jgi:Fe-S cluster assembly protein SufD
MSALLESKGTDFRRLFEGTVFPGDGLPWLADVRRTGLELFEGMGFPTVRQEEWRFTDVSAIAGTEYVPAPPAKAAVQDFHFLDFPGAALRLVFVNGRFAPELSSAGPCSHGVHCGSLAALLEKSPELLKDRLARRADPGRNPFVALNNAFFSDGAYIRLEAGAAPTSPIQIIFLSKPGVSPAVAHPRLLLVAEPGSQAVVVETHVGDGVYFTNTVAEILLGENAGLVHYRIQREGLHAAHVGTVQAEQGRNSRLDSFNISFGGGLTRHDIRSVLRGEGAECRLNGLFLAAGRQLVDNHTSMEHAAPHGTSRELYKGILAGKARGVFNGEVIVRPDAQKTDSIQVNNNLLLSKEALINTKPELRIHANDVKCKHGATIGQINPDLLFYFLSRGIGREAARRLLTQGFAAQVTDQIKHDFIREDLNRWVADWLPS